MSTVSGPTLKVEVDYALTIGGHVSKRGQDGFDLEVSHLVKSDYVFDLASQSAKKRIAHFEKCESHEVDITNMWLSAELVVP